MARACMNTMAEFCFFVYFTKLEAFCFYYSLVSRKNFIHMEHLQFCSARFSLYAKIQVLVASGGNSVQFLFVAISIFVQ